MSDPSSQKEQFDRLKAMLGEDCLCEELIKLELDEPEEENGLVLVPCPREVGDEEIFSDPDDDEKILSVDHMIGGRLEQLLESSLGEISDFPEYNLKFAEQAPAGEQFCPLQELIKFPYKYIAAAYRNRVVRTYFDKGQIYERRWDFFYIYPPGTLSQKAYLLLPSCQVKHFFFTINSVLGTRLTMPKDALKTGFLMEFPGDGTPRPRYLGMANEREMAECLRLSIPSRSWRSDNESEVDTEPTDTSVEAFKRKMELLVESDRKKKVAGKEKKKMERFAKQQSWNHTVKRVQRYLGTRETHCDNSQANGDKKESFVFNLKQPEYDQNVKEGAAEAIKVALDIQKPPPFKTEGDVIFICVDIEAWERDQNLITEIGVATLDTADIVSLAPGAGGENWRGAIRSRHFRIKEYLHLKNHSFVGGCAENFRFGSSECISIRDARREISECFEHPCSRNDNATLTRSCLDRSIVLVGHNLEADIKFLNILGYNPNKLSNLRELVDTCSMYRAFRREAQPRSLGGILADLDIAGWDLHNAGNDATYTLQAMMCIALKSMVEKQDKETREQEKKTRIEDSVKNAYNEALQAQQGWSSEGSDGGDPQPPI